MVDRGPTGRPSPSRVTTGRTAAEPRGPRTSGGRRTGDPPQYWGEAPRGPPGPPVPGAFPPEPVS